jgi:hypothetical protein
MFIIRQVIYQVTEHVFQKVNGFRKTKKILSLALSFIFTVNFEVLVKSQFEMETFIENQKTDLICKCNATRNQNVILINDSVIIDKYEWFKDGSIFSNGSKLMIDKLDQKIHNGSYICQITLKNNQTIASSSFLMIVYKC